MRIAVSELNGKAQADEPHIWSYVLVDNVLFTVVMVSIISSIIDDIVCEYVRHCLKEFIKKRH